MRRHRVSAGPRAKERERERVSFFLWAYIILGFEKTRNFSNWLINLSSFLELLICPPTSEPTGRFGQVPPPAPLHPLVPEGGREDC